MKLVFESGAPWSAQRALAGRSRYKVSDVDHRAQGHIRTGVACVSQGQP